MDCIICNTEMKHLVDDLHICNECGLISSDIKPDPSMYDKSYIIKYKRYEKSPIGVELQRIRHEIVKRHIQHGRLLDFGCGVGTFVKHCNKNGFKAEGFDINAYGDYCDINTLLQPYEIVTFWDSIEHLKNPTRTIEGFESEYLFISTPSIDDFSPDNKKLPLWRHYMPEEHVHYFSMKSLRELFKVCRYKVLEVNYNESLYRNGGGAKNIVTIAGRHG